MFFYDVVDQPAERNEFFQQLSTSNSSTASSPSPMQPWQACGSWDPASICETNDPQLVGRGQVKRGRDGREWIVVATSPRQLQWVLSTHNLPIVRPTSLLTEVQTKGGIPLLTKGWWKWSTIPGVEHFWVVECGGGGDCLFLSIGKAFGWESRTVRDMAAASLDDPSQFSSFLQGALRHRRAGEHYGWNVEQIRTVNDMKTIIKTPGNLYWGDTSTLQLLAESALFKRSRIGFLVFRTDGMIDPRLFAAEGITPDYYCLLYNDHNVHWQFVHCDGISLVPRSNPWIETILRVSWLREYDRTLFPTKKE